MYRYSLKAACGGWVGVPGLSVWLPVDDRSVAQQNLTAIQQKTNTQAATSQHHLTDGIIQRSPQMKLFYFLASVLVQAVVAQVPEREFCGDQPCLIDTPIACTVFETDYNFQGSCCSLVEIPSIRGCRIEIAGAGNCFWTPICGVCEKDDDAECNVVYETTTTEPCKPSPFDPFNSTNKITCPPTPPPTPAPTGIPFNSAASSHGLMASALGILYSAWLNMS